MTDKPGHASDDVSSAPESGTVRDDTSGNQPSDRGNDPAQAARKAGKPNPQNADDAGDAPEEG